MVKGNSSCNGIFRVCFNSEENIKVLKILETCFHFDSRKIDADASTIHVTIRTGQPTYRSHIFCLIHVYLLSNDVYILGK